MLSNSLMSNFVMKRQESYQVYPCLNKNNSSRAFKFVDIKICQEDKNHINCTPV